MRYDEITLILSTLKSNERRVECVNEVYMTEWKNVACKVGR